MIQANELRIFNWIADRGGKQWQIDHWESMNKVSAKPSTSMCMGILIENHPMTEYVDYLYPIPLTEEWLLKAGFEIKKNITNCITATILVDLVEIRVCSGFLDEKDIESYIIQYDGHGIAKCQYVNQLQNLYFALTGKELEFKL